MSRNTLQQGIAILLVLLFLGPSTIGLLHEHASDLGGHCTSEGEQHFHSLAAPADCFVCSFSFSTFQLDRPANFAAFDYPPQPAEPLPGNREFHALLLPFDHAPRGPPVMALTIAYGIGSA